MMATADDRAYLTAGGVSDALGSILTAYMVLSANASAILAQPDTTISLLATLPEDQALIREHVVRFRDGDLLGGGILLALQELLNVAHSVQATAAAMRLVAARLDAAGGSPDQADLDTFRTALGVLATSTTSLDPDSHSASVTLRAIQAAVDTFAQSEATDDVTRLVTAVKDAQFSGHLQHLQSQIATVQARIASLDEDIAGGATSQIGWAILFGFAIAAAIASAVAEPGLLVLEVGFAIKEGVDEGNSFAAEMRRKNAEIDSLITEYRQLVEGLQLEEQEMAILLTIAGHCSTYRDSVSSAAEALAALIKQTQLLRTGIQMLSLIDTPETTGFFEGQLTAATAAWATVADQCSQALTLARGLFTPPTPPGG